MRAGYVDFVPEGAKNVGTCGGVAGKEGIANAVDVMVGGTATSDSACRARVGGTEEDGAMSIHGARDVFEVGGTRGAEIGEGEDGS